MKTIDARVNNLAREKCKNNFLNNKELCKSSLFGLDYSGKIGYNYSEDRGVKMYCYCEEGLAAGG